MKESMEETPSALLILNGKGAGSDALRDAIHTLRAEGVRLEIRVTWEHGDAARFLAEAVALGCETVVAGGGDGTFNEVATALINLPEGTRPVLGLLPLGTANDFATSCDIPMVLEQALQLAIKGRAVDIDLARVNEKHYFINMATGGFGTRITTETPEKLKSALGSVSYFIHGLLRMDQLKADRCKITGPDFSWEGEALVIGVGNGRQAGGGQKICPDALINDGLLQLRLLTSEELLPSFIRSIMNNEENNNGLSASLSWLEINAPHSMTFNLDGEPLSGTQFRIEVVPNALQCRLPPQCPLLG